MLRQEDPEFEVSLSYIIRPYLKKRRERKGKERRREERRT
jgi:hypothetical protein